MLILTIINTGFGQTKDEINKFLKDRESSFNKGTKMIRINSIDSAIKVLRKKGISYTYTSFVFSGSDLNSNVIGGNIETVIESKRVPFHYYKVSKSERGKLIIEELEGTSCL